MNCLDCEHFTYWDGDYCCTWKMMILSEATESGKALNPDRVLEEDTCHDFSEAWDITKRVNKETWENLNKENDDNLN